jgi:hypothetical protein
VTAAILPAICSPWCLKPSISQGRLDRPSKNYHIRAILLWCCPSLVYPTPQNFSKMVVLKVDCTT